MAGREKRSKSRVIFSSPRLWVLSLLVFCFIVYHRFPSLQIHAQEKTDNIADTETQNRHSQADGGHFQEAPAEGQVFDDGDIEVKEENDQDPHQQSNAQAEKVVRQQQEGKDQ